MSQPIRVWFIGLCLFACLGGKPALAQRSIQDPENASESELLNEIEVGGVRQTLASPAKMV